MFIKYFNWYLLDHLLINKYNYQCNHYATMRGVHFQCLKHKGTNLQWKIMSTTRFKVEKNIAAYQASSLQAFFTFKLFDNFYFFFRTRGINLRYSYEKTDKQIISEAPFRGRSYKRLFYVRIE